MQYHDKDILRRHHKMAFRGSVSTHTAAVHLYLVRLEDSGVPQRTHTQAVDTAQQPPRVCRLEMVELSMPRTRDVGLRAVAGPVLQ